MYETYVPIAETVVERRPPTIAEIVRQKTDDGARIIDFFLDLMEGRVEDAKLCHRIDAAKQLVKYGYKKAADFIAEHGDEPCDHCESRRRGPRTRRDERPSANPQHAPGPFGYDFLTLLTEDFLTVLSAVDEDLMIKLVRAQTRDGGTVIDFLDDVMHGRDNGFKVNHRIAAARELISHILRDEHVIARTVLEVVADPRIRPLPASQVPSPSTLTPSPSTGEGWGEGDSPARCSVGAVSKPALPGAAWEPCNPESIVPALSTVVPADARRNPGNTTVVPAQAGFLPQEPSPTQRGGRAGSHLEPNTPVVPAEAGFLPQEPSPTQRGSEGRSGSQLETNNSKLETVPAPAELTSAERRIEEKIEAHRHEPDPWDAPIDSTTPGRSPPA